MKPEDIKLSDYARILLGEVPGEYLLELIIRTLVVYMILVVSMRLMGKRMASQLSRNELAALASLAAAVGIPLMSPDRGLLPGVVVAGVIVFIQRLVARRAFANETFEGFSQGRLDVLIRDGVLQHSTLLKNNLSRERVFAQLRSEHILHLGEVARMYMEANGTFTIIKAGEERPGMAIVPGFDAELLAEFKMHNDYLICANCGNPGPKQKSCPNCMKDRFIPAATCN